LIICSGFGGANEIQDEVWVKGNLELLKRCAALYAIGKHKESKEVIKEIQFSIDNRIPILTSRAEIMNYLKNYSLPETSESIQDKINVPEKIRKIMKE
jgi:hypothetical protein